MTPGLSGLAKDYAVLQQGGLSGRGLPDLTPVTIEFSTERVADRRKAGDKIAAYDEQSTSAGAAPNLGPAWRRCRQ